MSGKIIDLFTGKIIAEGSADAMKLDQDKLVFDPRNMWEKFKLQASTYAVPYQEVLQHEVYLSDVCKAIMLAGSLTMDTAATEFFIGLASRLAGLPTGHVLLQDLPNEMKGYVWNPSWSEFSKVIYYAEYVLPSVSMIKIHRVIVS